MSLEAKLSTRLSKREFLRNAAKGVIGATAGLLVAFNPDLAQVTKAAAVVFSSEDRRPLPRTIFSPRQAWSTRLWWPLAEEVALSYNPPQPKMQDDFWPAYVFDLEYQRAGEASDVQQQAVDKANKILTVQPDQRPSAGYCTWVAVAQSSTDRPTVKQGETLGDATDPEIIQQIKEGFRTIEYSGAPMVQINPEKLREVLLSKIPQGHKIIGNIPGRRSGIWFRSFNGIREDGEYVRATNFGYPDEDYPISAIESAYVVYSNKDLARLPFNPKVFADPEFWRFYNLKDERSELDRGFIDWLVAGKP